MDQVARMDFIDLKILAILQEDASTPLSEISERVNLSSTPCWRRIQKLEQSGVIQKRVALLDPSAMGLGLTVFVALETGDHSTEWLQQFADAIADMPEVMEVYRMAGDIDYMLKVVVPDTAGYDDFYRRLIARVPLKNVTSRFSMERIKSTTALRLDAAPVKR